jgi:hypothetical protein
MNKFNFDKKFPVDKEIMESLREWSNNMRKMSIHLQERAGLAMVNRKHPDEFDNEEIAGCAQKVASPYDFAFHEKTSDLKVSITMDENGYIITKIQPPGSISASFCWRMMRVTFSQLSEIEKRLPDYGYIKVDGRWQKA